RRRDRRRSDRQALLPRGRPHPAPARERRARADLRRARPDPRQGDGGLQESVTVEPLNRTLEQELNALLRGASLECLTCGEFVMHLPQGGIFCPEGGSGLDANVPAEAARDVA